MGIAPGTPGVDAAVTSSQPPGSDSPPREVLVHVRCCACPRHTARSSACKALRLGALAGGLMIGCLGTAVPAALAAATPMVSLGDGATYAALSGTSVANTVSGVGLPAHNAAWRPRREGQHPADRLSARCGHRRDRDRHPRGRRRARRPRRGLHRDQGPDGRRHARPRARRQDRRAGAAHDRRRRVEHHDGDPRRRGRPGRRLRLPGQRRPRLRRRKPRRARRRRPGVAGVLAGQRRRRARRQRRLRGNAHGEAAVDAGTRPSSTAACSPATAPSRSTPTRSTARPPVVTIAGGAVAYTTDTTPTISGTTDVEAPAVVTVTFAGQTLTATPAPSGAWSVTSAIRGTAPTPSSPRSSTARATRAAPPSS